jgi:hypothetical protein
MQQHLHILGILHIVYASLSLLTFVVLSLVFGGLAFLSGAEILRGLFAVIVLIVGFLLLLLAVPQIIGAIGLLTHKPWSRILMIIVGALHLMSVPFGTALGIYTFWVLTKEESIRILSHPPAA